MGGCYGRNGLGSQSRLIVRIYHYKYFGSVYLVGGGGAFLLWGGFWSMLYSRSSGNGTQGVSW